MVDPTFALPVAELDVARAWIGIFFYAFLSSVSLVYSLLLLAANSFNPFIYFRF